MDTALKTLLKALILGLLVFIAYSIYTSMKAGNAPVDAIKAGVSAPVTGAKNLASKSGVSGVLTIAKNLVTGQTSLTDSSSALRALLFPS